MQPDADRVRRPAAVFAVIHDVTKLKRIEADLAAARDIGD